MVTYKVTAELNTPWWLKVLRFFHLKSKREEFEIIMDKDWYSKGDIIRNGGGNVKIVGYKKQNMENYLIKDKDALFKHTLDNMLGYFNSKYKESKLSYEDGNFKIDGVNEIEMQQMAEEVREIIDFADKK